MSPLAISFIHPARQLIHAAIQRRMVSSMPPLARSFIYYSDDIVDPYLTTVCFTGMTPLEWLPLAAYG